MKVSIEKEVLLSGLAKIQNIAEKKSTVQVLSFVLLETKENMLCITATDMEVGLKVNLFCKVENFGAIALPAKKFYEIIREFPNKEIFLETLDNFHFKISFEKIFFTISGLDPTQFPGFPESEKTILFDVNGSILKKMIDRTYFSMSNDEAKYNLNGIFFKKINNKEKSFLIMVSTDIHRLAYTKEEIEIPEIEDIKKGLIIPKKGIMEIRKLIESENKNLKLGFFENNAVFFKENINLVVRLVDGEFPEFSKVIPEIQEDFISIDKEVFLRVLKRISTLTNERFRGIQLFFAPDKLEISVKNPEFGEGKEEISIDYHGEEITMAYNARYLIEAVSAYHTEKIRFQFRDNASPAIVAPLNDSNSLAVIMPMRL